MSTVDGWHRTNLGNLLTLVRNGYSGQQVSRVTDFPVSRIETISEGRVDTSKVGFAESIPDSYLLESGDILFSNINSLKHIGKVARVEAGTKLFHGMNLLVLRPADEIDKRFLFYVLVRAKPWFEKMAAQAINQASINQTTVRVLPLHVPEKKLEQTKIAEVLSTVDQAIEQTESLIAKQQRIKTGLMQDLLTRGIDEHGNLRSEETHEFKDSPLGRIPVEWGVQKFEDITPGDAPIGYGIIQPGAYDYAGVRVAGIYTINTGFRQWHMSSKKIEQAYGRSRIEPGDVLLSIKGTTGRVGVVPAETTGNISREIARIRPLEDINSYFLRFLMLSDFFQQYLGNAEVGTTRAELSIKVLRVLSALVPPLSEQNEIVSRLTAVERTLESGQRALAKLRSQKSALMQDLLTGEKRVTPLLEADDDQAAGSAP